MVNSWLLIGSDSFIARHFIQLNQFSSVRGISRSNVNKLNELSINDFFKIPNEEFFFKDVVFNFSAIVHRPKLKDHSIYNEVNHLLSLKNAIKAKQAGVKLFVQMSTISVYGNANEISESSPYSPNNPYGSTKLAADEELLKMQDDNFKVAIVRPPMVYGGGNAPGNMMRLIKLADKGIPLPFKGIDNRRDFINVNNLVQYLTIIAEKKLSGIFLIADQEPVSTEYLLSCICKYLGRDVRLIRIPDFGLSMLKNFRPHEFQKLFGTLRIETNFPFENLIKKYSVDSGIKEMIECYKARIGN